MKNTKFNIIALALIVLPLLASCRQELCYDHYPSVNVSLEWEHEWERDYGMAHSSNWDTQLHGFGYDEMRPGVPEWVNLMEFSPDGKVEEHFLSIKGGKFTINDSEGKSFLLYNGDTEYIVIEDMASISDARATTTSRSRASLQYIMSITPGTRTANPPDLLYGAYIENLPAIGVHQTHPLPVKMQPLVYTYVIRYEFEHGLEHVALARGAIGGMAESVYLRDGVTSDNSAILLYDCDLTDYGCVAYVRSFGVPSFPDNFYGKTRNNRPPVTVNLELRLKNGKYVEFNTDVSQIVANQPRGGVIRLTGFRVEDEEAMGGSGFDVEVDGWGDPIDIPLTI